MATPTKWGAELLVNTITVGNQSAPAVTSLANGRFVVTWTDTSGTLGDNSGSAVHGQLFDANGIKSGAEFLVNTVTAGDQYVPKITALADGRFVAVWSDFSAGTGNVRAQLFNVDGSRSAAEFVVNAATEPTGLIPTITALADGRYAVAWGGTVGGIDEDIRVQIFNSDGTRSGAEFIATDTTTGLQLEAVITGLADGRFVVAWYGLPGDTSGSAIRAQMWNADGTKWGFELAVNTTTPGTQFQPTMSALADGRFVIAWTDASQTGGDVSGFALRAQVFNFDGSKSGSEFLVNTTTLNQQSQPCIATLDDGRFVISFVDDSHSADDSSATAIRSQIFNPDGTRSGAEFLTNIGTTGGPQFAPAIAVLADGRFVTAWTDSSQSGGDTSGKAVRAQIFDPRESALLLTGTGLDDDFVGTGFNDTLIGGAGTDRLEGAGGDDTLDGGVGADTMVGGVGNDIHVVDNPGDAVIENAGEGTDTVIASINAALPMNIENLILAAGAGAINGSGNALDNMIAGNAGNNALTGGGGNDTIDGAAGDDTAVCSQNLGQYTIRDFGARILASGPDGTDTMTGVEHLQFADTTLDVVDDGNALFDALYYFSRNTDVYFAGVNPLEHYNAFGRHEGRDPNGLFDTSGYLAANPDVAASGVNPLEHYHQIGWHQGRDPSAAFDTTLYLIHNPDVAAAGVDPLAHFLAHGFSEGRAAYAAVGPTVSGFDAQYYLFHNPDVAAAGVDPIAHFNTFGWHEGRNPNGYFDSAGYLAHYADVAAAGANPLQHYLTFGWHEGRDASAGFDTLGYLAANPDVAAAGVDPLDHFLNFGIYEGRAAVNDGLWG